MESKAHDAALRLINEIALIDSDIAAKLKPTIDMFVESVDASIYNSDFFNKVAEMFKTCKTEEEKNAFLNKEENKGFLDALKQLNGMVKGESNTVSEEKETENGEVLTDIPLQSTVKDEKKSKKKDEEAEEDDGPAAPELPEDGFKGNKVTAPLKIKDDDQRLMGKEPPKESELDPNNKPKVTDATPDSEVKIPDLTKMKTTLESVRTFYKRYMRESIMPMLKKERLIRESSIEGIDDKYVEFLNDRQFDRALTAIENGTTKQMSRFVPIRTYASQLFDKFKEEIGTYDNAMNIAKTWYANKGRQNREYQKVVPARVFVELRHVSGSDFVANIFLVKNKDNKYGNELTYEDQELASDMNETYTGEYSDDRSDLFQPMVKVNDKEANHSNVWKMTIPFPKPADGKGMAISRIKHDIVKFINDHYKKTHTASSIVPNWIYSYKSKSEVTTESVGDFDKNSVQDLAQEFIEDIISMGDNPDDMTVYDFMDWAWDGKVPEEDKAYVAKMFNYERSTMFKESKHCKSVNESSDYIKSILFDIFKEIFDDYLTNENPDDTVDWDDAYEFISDKFINNFEDYDVPKDLVADITSLDFEEVQDLVDEFLNDTKEMLAMGTDPINIGEE